MKCLNCSNEMADGLSQCPECGASVSRANQPPPWIKLLGLVLVCSLIGLVAAIIIQKREPVSPATSDPAPAPVANVQDTRTKAEAGDAAAQSLLGDMYSKGTGAPQDYKQAAIWYRKAADQGHAGSQNYLAQLYEVGQGVPRDGAEAAKWFQKAAEQGNVSAQYSLAAMFASGRGINVDQAKAVKWFRIAAEAGDGLAQYNLGKRATIGENVPRDPVEAFKWLSLSAAQGEPDAIKARDELKRTLTSKQLADGQQRVDAFVPTKLTGLAK